jgi:hypothetical protein
MKKLVLITLLFIVPLGLMAQHPFYRKTEHKTVKRLKKHELKKIQSGHNLYYRDGNKVYKTSRFYSGIKRPKDATNRKNNKK